MIANASPRLSMSICGGWRKLTAPVTRTQLELAAAAGESADYGSVLGTSGGGDHIGTL
ncbi:MAG: hypothetical protein R2932_20980 [Caldilineaceae bacterium]